MAKTDDDESAGRPTVIGARSMRTPRIEDMPTIDEPPTTEVGFALDGEVVGGRFRLGERLSWGGMGTVFRALDLVTEREVAVKIPHLGDPRNDARFQAETAAVASVVCSSVIAYVAHGSTEEPFLAMELVVGDPLVTHLQRGALDVATTLGLGRRIASALAAIHLGGWVHRDIKPGNIVVALDGTAKLLDFGLSRELGPARAGATTAGQVLGTLSYMAPEQLIPNRQPDTRSDVYSLGVVLYECLTGKRAFHRTVADIVARRVDATLDVQKLRLPPRLTSTLERALAVPKDERQEDGLDLLVELVGASEPAFVAPPLRETRAAIANLLRMGAVHLTGELRRAQGDAPVTPPAGERPRSSGAGSATLSGAPARAIARVFAEIVAPSVVVRLACDPLGAAIPGSHAAALAGLLASIGHTDLAGRVTGRRRAEVPDGAPALVVLVDDALYCDPKSADVLAALASERALYVVAASPFEDELARATFEALPRVSGPWADVDDLRALTPMGRWYLRAAGMFGWRFEASAVAELVGGPEAREVGASLDELVERGLVRADPLGVRPGFAFTSSRALATARRAARRHELRLGTRLALEAKARPRVVAERIVAVDASCPALASIEALR